MPAACKKLQQTQQVFIHVSGRYTIKFVSIFDSLKLISNEIDLKTNPLAQKVFYRTKKN